MRTEQSLPTLETVWREVWNVVGHLTTRHTFELGAQPICQGQPSDTVFFVRSGTVKVVCCDRSGDLVITALHSAGWILGAEAAIQGAPHECSAIVVEKAEIASISSVDFLKLLQTSAVLSWYLHRMQSTEVTDLVVQQMVLRTAGSRARYVHFLCKLLSAKGQAFSLEPVRMNIPLRQHEVAQLVSVTPEHLCRVTKALESQGVIRREKSSLMVFNPCELARSIQFSQG